MALKKFVTRRQVLKAAGATAAVAGFSPFAPAIAAGKVFKIGYVSPQTGPLAAFAEADNFVISDFLNTVKGGVKVGSATLSARPTGSCSISPASISARA
jgi:branched-chain amino acid transport system substrate-binding protein